MSRPICIGIIFLGRLFTGRSGLGFSKAFKRTSSRHPPLARSALLRRLPVCLSAGETKARSSTAEARAKTATITKKGTPEAILSGTSGFAALFQAVSLFLARSGQSATRSRRDRHDGNADACTSGVWRRDMDNRTHGCHA